MTNPTLQEESRPSSHPSPKAVTVLCKGVLFDMDGHPDLIPGLCCAQLDNLGRLPRSRRIHRHPHRHTAVVPLKRFVNSAPISTIRPSFNTLKTSKSRTTRVSPFSRRPCPAQQPSCRPLDRRHFRDRPSRPGPFSRGWRPCSFQDHHRRSCRQRQAPPRAPTCAERKSSACPVPNVLSLKTQLPAPGPAAPPDRP